MWGPGYAAAFNFSLCASLLVVLKKQGELGSKKQKLKLFFFNGESS